MSEARTAPSARILIVEDEALIAAELEDRLQRRGFEVLGPVDTADAAIATVEMHRPDLVLMDIRLKGERDGIAAAGEVQSRFATPVLFLTANADTATYRRAQGTMPYGYVVKPFNERDLVVAVDTALIRARAEKALRQDSLTFSTIAAAVADAVIVTDTDNRLRYLNAAAERLTGWSWTDVVGRERPSTLSFVETGGSAPASDPGNVSLVHGVLTTRDGRTVSVVERRVPVLDPTGTHLGTVSSLIHADELERLRRAMAESEALSEAVFTAAPHPMALLDRRALLVRANAAFLRLTGLNPVHFPLPAASLLDNGPAESIEALVRAAQPQRAGVPVELHIAGTTGTSVLVSSTMVALPMSTTDTGEMILWSCLPIDAQKRLITSLMAQEENRTTVRTDRLPFMRVLVVEDEPSLRQIIRRMLERMGARVHVAEHGQAAVAFLQRERPHVDVVLTDMVMPQLSGGELLAFIEAHFPELPVVFMSGYHDDQHVQREVDLAHRPMVRKPFTHAQLIDALRTAFDAAPGVSGARDASRPPGDTDSPRHQPQTR